MIQWELIINVFIGLLAYNIVGKAVLIIMFKCIVNAAMSYDNERSRMKISLTNLLNKIEDYERKQSNTSR